jgi:hypothetical protein
MKKDKENIQDIEQVKERKHIALNIFVLVFYVVLVLGTL